MAGLIMLNENCYQIFFFPPENRLLGRTIRDGADELFQIE